VLVGPGRLPGLELPLLGARCANAGMHKARRIKAAKLDRLERYIYVLLNGEIAEERYSGPCRPMLPRFMPPNHANPAPEAGQNGHSFPELAVARVSMSKQTFVSRSLTQFSTEFALL
jgi:hypothetical protein